MVEVSFIFQGKHDFRNFTRARKNTVLRIDRIDVSHQDGLIILDFRARNYLWNLIRRIVAAMEAYSLGRDFGDEVFSKRVNFGLAPPEPLVLMDVRYDFEFKQVKIKKNVRRDLSRMFLKSMVYRYLSTLGKI